MWDCVQTEHFALMRKVWEGSENAERVEDRRTSDCQSGTGGCCQLGAMDADGLVQSRPLAKLD